MAGAAQESQVYLHMDPTPSTPSTEDSTHSTEADSAFWRKLQAMVGDTSLLSSPASTNGVDDLRFLFQTSQVTATTAGRYMITLPLRQSHYSTSHHVTSPHPLILPRLHFYDVTITS